MLAPRRHGRAAVDAAPRRPQLTTRRSARTATTTASRPGVAVLLHPPSHQRRLGQLRPPGRPASARPAGGRRRASRGRPSRRPARAAAVASRRSATRSSSRPRRAAAAHGSGGAWRRTRPRSRSMPSRSLTSKNAPAATSGGGPGRPGQRGDIGHDDELGEHRQPAGRLGTGAAGVQPLGQAAPGPGRLRAIELRQRLGQPPEHRADPVDPRRPRSAGRPPSSSWRVSASSSSATTSPGSARSAAASGAAGATVAAVSCQSADPSATERATQ